MVRISSPLASLRRADRSSIRTACRQERHDREVRRQRSRRSSRTTSTAINSLISVSRAALRQAPRPDHHRPAQLSQPRSDSDDSARQAWRPRSSTACSPRRRCRCSTAGAPSTAAIRPRRSHSGTCASPTRRQARRRKRFSEPSRRPGSRSSCARRRRRGRSGATRSGTLDWRADPENLPPGLTKSRGRADICAILAAGDHGSAWVERGEIYDFVRDAKITGFRDRLGRPSQLLGRLCRRATPARQV